MAATSSRYAGAKRRTLLAMLVLHANEVVRADRLVDELWGEHPPSNAAAALQSHVSRAPEGPRRGRRRDEAVGIRPPCGPADDRPSPVRSARRRGADAAGRGAGHRAPRGARAVARATARRPRQRARTRRPHRASAGAPAVCARAANRCRPRDRDPFRARAGAREPRRASAVARTAARSADPRAVPSGSTGGGARDVSGDAARPRRRARHRAERGAPRAGAGDPAPGPGTHRRSVGARADTPRRSRIPVAPVAAYSRGRGRPHSRGGSSCRADARSAIADHSSVRGLRRERRNRNRRAHRRSRPSAPAKAAVEATSWERTCRTCKNRARRHRGPLHGNPASGRAPRSRSHATDAAGEVVGDHRNTP